MITYEKRETLTFDTHRRKPKTTINLNRKGSIVRERCKQLTEILREWFPDGIVSEEDLVNFIEDHIGADKETIRSYKGYYGHVRAGRCGDNKIVGLSRKGYLEKFHFLKKLPGARWMICQTQLSYQAKESLIMGVGSNEKISISLPVSGVDEKGLLFDGKSVSSSEREEEEASEKDRNFTPKIIGLSLKELALEDALEDALYYVPDGKKFGYCPKCSKPKSLNDFEYPARFGKDSDFCEKCFLWRSTRMTNFKLSNHRKPFTYVNEIYTKGKGLK